MKKLKAVPFEGIGKLKLGDSREEILSKVKGLLKETGIDEDELQVACDYSLTGGYTRYFAGEIFILASFDKEDRAVEICFNKSGKELLPVFLYDIDVFSTPAYELTAFLKGKSAVEYDCEDEELSYNYEFPEIGVRLWRDGVFHPKLLKDKTYMEEMKEVLEDEKQFLYFDIIGIKSR